MGSDGRQKLKCTFFIFQVNETTDLPAPDQVRISQWYAQGGVNVIFMENHYRL